MPRKKKKDKQTTRQAYGITVLKAADPRIRKLKKDHTPFIHGNKFWNSSWCVMDFLARQGLPQDANVLELGCGWGSLTLWLGKHYPNAKVTAVSNSTTQKIYIDRKAAEQGIKNINVVTCDMNDFATDETFDRVLSIEMFEHMRNYEMLFERIATWLRHPASCGFISSAIKPCPTFFKMTAKRTGWRGTFLRVG